MIVPGDHHGGTIDPHGDHRIAMSLGTAGLVIEGVEVANPSVVNKTWPDFWSKLSEFSRNES